MRKIIIIFLIISFINVSMCSKNQTKKIKEDKVINKYIDDNDLIEKNVIYRELSEQEDNSNNNTNTESNKTVNFQKVKFISENLREIISKLKIINKNQTRVFNLCLDNEIKTCFFPFDLLTLKNKKAFITKQQNIVSKLKKWTDKQKKNLNYTTFINYVDTNLTTIDNYWGCISSGIKSCIPV